MGNTVASKFNSPCTLTIILDPPTADSYVAGQTISGSIYAKAKSKVPAGKKINVRAHLSGKEKTCVSYQTYDSEGDSTTNYAHAERNIVHMAIHLADLSIGIEAKARYRFPFKITLPHDLPSSMQLKHGGDSCSIKYKITAELEGSGLFRTYQVEEEINIISAPLSDQPLPHFIEPILREMNVCCCIKKGTIMMSAKVSDTRIGHGESAVIDFACKNLSERQIEKAEAKIRQSVKWSAQGESATSQETIVKRTFRPTERWKKLDKQDLNELRATYDPNQSMLLMLHKAILNADNRRSLEVPHTSLHSYQGCIITIEHQFMIKVHTKGIFSTNPTIELPLFIGTPSSFLIEDTPATISLPDPPPEWADSGDDSPVISTKPTEVGPSDAVLGGAEVKKKGGKGSKGDDPDEGDITVPPLQEKLDPTLPNLLNEMRYAISPVSTVRYHLSETTWKEKVFDALTPQEYVSIIKAVSIEFDQPEMAATIAPAIHGGNFTHEYIIAAIRAVSEWLRIPMVQRLLPYCKDLDKNKNTILSYLSDWERICTEKDFEKATK